MEQRHRWQMAPLGSPPEPPPAPPNRLPPRHTLHSPSPARPQDGVTETCLHVHTHVCTRKVTEMFTHEPKALSGPPLLLLSLKISPRPVLAWESVGRGGSAGRAAESSRGALTPSLLTAQSVLACVPDVASSVTQGRVNAGSGGEHFLWDTPRICICLNLLAVWLWASYSVSLSLFPHL